MGNTNMHKARRVKNDEFYTRITDIEREVLKYEKYFKDKIIYMNCDDPMYENIDGQMEIHNEGSHFWNFFYLQFERLGLKKIISTHYDYENPTYKLEYEGGGIDNIIKTPLKQNGDFRSDESIECLKEADIVCTNPPFSLFREYVAQLIEYKKEFLIIGNFNAVTYKEIFPLIKDNKMWLGYTAPKEFVQPDGTIKKFGNIHWFTNIDVTKRHEDIFLYKDYYGNEESYPKYDNYDAIEVSRVKDIPRDYEGVMGVPITFLTKYNPEQFKVLDLAKRGGDFMQMRTKHYTKDEYENASDLNAAPTLFNDDGTLRNTYARILIRNKNPEINKGDE